MLWAYVWPNANLTDCWLLTTTVVDVSLCLASKYIPYFASSALLIQKERKEKEGEEKANTLSTNQLAISRNFYNSYGFKKTYFVCLFGNIFSFLRIGDRRSKEWVGCLCVCVCS